MTRPSEPMAPLDALADAARFQLQDALESPFTVDFSTEVLTEIRQSALEAFRSLPYGGLEVGGVLFGQVVPSGRNPRKVEVAATRRIECEHAAGPAFILSGAERVRLNQLFERARQEEELAALAVVGFWVSHGRSELGLTTHDTDLYRAFFPHPWQIALVLKPENRRPLREALFCRIEGRVFPYKRPGDVVLPAPVVLAPPVLPELPAPLPEAMLKLTPEIAPEPAPEIAPEPAPELAAEIAPEPAPAVLGQSFNHLSDAPLEVAPPVQELLPVEPSVETPVTDEPVVDVAPYVVYPEPPAAAQIEPESEPRFFEYPAPPQEFHALAAPAPPPAAAPDVPRFATDIYLPTPPVEPPSNKPWANDLYRPVGRNRALLQSVPAPTAATPPAVEEELPEVPELPQLRSYREVEEPKLEAPVEAEPEPALVAASEPEGNPAPEAAIVEAAPDPNIPPSFQLSLPAAPVPEAEPVRALGFTRAHATPLDPYIPPAPVALPPTPPVVAAAPIPAAETQAPDAGRVNDELARLLTTLRDATAETRRKRSYENEPEEAHRAPRTRVVARHSFGLVTLLVLLLAGLLLGGAVSYFLFGSHQPVAAKAPGPDLGVEMFNSGKNVLIHWQAKSPLILNARTAELRIHDGSMVQTLLLDLGGLSKGYYRYKPTSGDVQATLIVTENDGRIEQSIATRFSE